jgi:hypothetical protein
MKSGNSSLLSKSILKTNSKTPVCLYVILNHIFLLLGKKKKENIKKYNSDITTRVYTTVK